MIAPLQRSPTSNSFSVVLDERAIPDTAYCVTSSWLEVLSKQPE